MQHRAARRSRIKPDRTTSRQPIGSTVDSPSLLLQAVPAWLNPDEQLRCVAVAFSVFRKKDAIGLLGISGAGLLDHCRVERLAQSTGVNCIPDEQKKRPRHEVRVPPPIP